MSFSWTRKGCKLKSWYLGYAEWPPTGHCWKYNMSFSVGGIFGEIVEGEKYFKRCFHLMTRKCFKVKVETQNNLIWSSFWFRNFQPQGADLLCHMFIPAQVDKRRGGWRPRPQVTWRCCCRAAQSALWRTLWAPASWPSALGSADRSGWRTSQCGCRCSSPVS